MQQTMMDEVATPSPPPPPSPQDMAQPMDLSPEKSLSPSSSAVVSAGVKSNQVSSVVLHGVSIVSLHMDGTERLCLAQISNTLLKDFSYNEIHNRRVALGITCVQCTPVQLEVLRRAGAMPISSRRCGMITKREAERLVKSFLEEHKPPKLPENFAFSVHHSCGWGCKGHFVPSRYNSSRAKCIKCTFCNVFFSPNKFIFHFHRTPEAKYRHPDAANFNSWRRHLDLEYGPTGINEDLRHAWEDVKAMFNGGSRKRLLPEITSPVPTSSKPPSCMVSRLSDGLDHPTPCKSLRLELPTDRPGGYSNMGGSDQRPLPYPPTIPPGFTNAAGLQMPMLPTAAAAAAAAAAAHGGYPSVPMLPCPPQTDSSLPPTRPPHNLSLLDMWRGARQAGMAAQSYHNPFGLMWPRNTAAGALMTPAIKLQDTAMPSPAAGRDFPTTMGFMFSNRRRTSAAAAAAAGVHMSHLPALQSAFRPVHGGIYDQAGGMARLHHPPAAAEDSPGDSSPDPGEDSDDAPDSPPSFPDPEPDIDVCDSATIGECSADSGTGTGGGDDGGNVASQDSNSNKPYMQVMFPGMDEAMEANKDKGQNNEEEEKVPPRTAEEIKIDTEDRTLDTVNNKLTVSNATGSPAQCSAALKTDTGAKQSSLQQAASSQCAVSPHNNNTKVTEDRNTPNCVRTQQQDPLNNVMHMSKEELQAELLRVLSERSSAEHEYKRLKEQIEEHSQESQARAGALQAELRQVQERIADEIEQERKAKLTVQRQVKDARESLEQMTGNMTVLRTDT